MGASVSILAIVAIAFALAGCVHTALPEQQISPAPIGTAKVPLKIAVVNDPSIVVHEPMGFYENLNPALSNTVRDALSLHFGEVTIFQNDKSLQEADLIAIPSIDEPFSKSLLQLTVAFENPKKNQRVANLSATDHLHADAPGANDHLGPDLGITAASLVAPPLYLLAFRTVERHDADRFNARFGPALTAMANDIAKQATVDPNITALANQSH